MTPYLLAPLESHIRNRTAFAVLTQKINPVLGSPERPPSTATSHGSTAAGSRAVKPACRSIYRRWATRIPTPPPGQ